MNILYLNSDQLGQSYPELGKKLVISYLKNIIANAIKIDAVFCINSGVYLTTKNPETISVFKEMEAKGTTISTCGTCLDFYQLRDELQVGEIGSMNFAIQLMQQAEKVYRL